MNRLQKIYSKSRLAAIMTVSLLGVFVVVSGVSAATTISTNINTEGTLNVTDATTLGSTLAVTGNLSVNGNATTTASSGQFATQGSIGTGTTTPSTEISASGTATTTLYLHSTTSNKGGCIEFKAANSATAIYRAYATTTGPLILESGSCK